MSNITLKWGTLTGWDLDTDKEMDFLKQYMDLGVSVSAMMQKDTTKQKEILCSLIDEVDGDIFNDWDGVNMTKEAAKTYVMEYGS